MDYLEKAKKEIREEWFGNHIIKRDSSMEGLRLILFGEPGTSMYQVKYVLSGNNVFISGDLGEAVYNLTCSATLENIKGFDLSYFTGKLAAHSSSRWNFDESKAKKELNEYWEEFRISNRDDAQQIKSGILNAIRESSSLVEYQFHLTNLYNETSLDSDDMSYIWEFGKRLPYSFISYWLGLQMVAEKLLSENKTA